MTKARVALLRHAPTAWNRAGRIQGRTDEPLDADAEAHLQALCLPADFQDWPVLSSPLRRAVRTAELLAGPPAIVPALIEMDWGDWEGLRGVDLIAEPSSGHRHLDQWGWDFRPPNGESPADVRDRLSPWLSALSGPALVVTHIGVMRVLLALGTGWDFRGEPPFAVKRDRLYRIDLDADGSLRLAGEPIRLKARA